MHDDNHIETQKNALSNTDLNPAFLDDVLNSLLEEALKKSDYANQVIEIASIASTHDPIDIAYAAARMPTNVRLILFENLTTAENKIIFLINTNSHTRSFILRHLDDSELVNLINLTPTDEAVWILDDVPDRRFRHILPRLPLPKGEAIKELRLKDRHSAARLMVNDFCAFNLNNTVEEVADYLRLHPNIEVTRRIFVLDDEQKLVGFVPARTLIIRPFNTRLSQIMRPVNHQVSPEATREEVIEVVERYKIPALPVVDDEDQLVGVITYEDVVEALEDVADEIMAQMGGTAEHVGEMQPVFKRFLLRMPWLLVTLIAGLVNAMGMAFFESREGSVLAFVLFFVPLITGMSGNIGIQCSTVIVRGMATGAFSLSARSTALRKEIFIGLMAGFCFGILAGVIVYFLDFVGCPLVCVHPLKVAVLVSVGLLGGCLCGTLLGVFSPWFFANVGVDPAVASGPIVTAFNDFFSMIIYFLIAWGLSSLFFI